MTVIELINTLNEIPIEFQDRDVQLYIRCGQISGILDISDIDPIPFDNTDDSCAIYINHHSKEF